ncbi:MAG: polysaccharide deacetylase family protein [Gaiellales bacterium]
MSHRAAWAAALAVCAVLAAAGCSSGKAATETRSTSASNPPPASSTATSAPTTTATAPPVPHEPPGRPVPILMYHVIGTPPAGAPYPGLFVSPGDFRAQMAYLARAGYHPVTLGQVWSYWHGGTLPVRPVVLTFDDGYRGDATVAAPVLHRRGWPAVLNLLVANLHRHGWGLKIPQVQKMVAQGWEIASHTLTHPDLTTLPAADLQHELAGSRQVLRRTFHQPVDFFCYPAGRYNDTVIAAVRRAGYLGATSELPGKATLAERWTLPRIRISDTTTVAELAGALAG